MLNEDFSEVKERLYKSEETLSCFAKKAKDSKGRLEDEEECPFRTVFQRDRDRILYSKAFRRLKGKTQVFYAPENDHLRTRLTHTIEVSQISRTIARILNLNEDLTEAIALGHDLGHAPFGHTGEDALNSVIEGGFKHNIHSVRVASVIEKLNLTREVLDGILNHTGENIPYTLEGQIVRISDRIAYLSSDVEDAIRENVIKKEDVPFEFIEYFGSHKREMINKIISNIYFNSVEKNEIKMDDDCVNFLNNLRSWMFKNVYFSDKTKSEEQHIKKIVIELFNYYKEKCGEQGAIDYVAGMSDEFALSEYENIFKETIWLKSPSNKQLKK